MRRLQILNLESDEIKCSILMESGTQSTWETPLGAGNKPNKPHSSMASRPGIEPGAHSWKSKALSTTSLISMPYATKFICFNVNGLRSFATLLKQYRKIVLKIFRPFFRYCLSSVAKLRRSLILKLFPSAIQMKFH